MFQYHLQYNTKMKMGNLTHCIGHLWQMSQMASVMSPGLKSPPWSTHKIVSYFIDQLLLMTDAQMY